MIHVYNALNLAIWAPVAIHFDRWWIALFACVTMVVSKRKSEHDMNSDEEDRQ